MTLRLALCTLALLAALLPFASHAPNRLLSGAAIPLTAIRYAWLLPIPLALTLLRRPPLALAAAALGFGAVLVLAGATATDLAAGAKPAARTSLSSGGWLMLAAFALLAIDAGRRIGRAAAGFALASVLAAVLATGALENLGVMREYAVRRAAFWADAGRHAEIVAWAAVPAILIGLPLGYLARSRGKILAGLGLLQTIPSLALFGLLIPLLPAFGLPGIGLLPATLALTAYALLPVAAATASGFAAVPAPVRDAARGIGFSGAEILRRVDVPLAWPVILSGVRVMLVQTIGLATVAALVGAGGLGSLVFEGLFANALDLVLLGTLPIVTLALLADAALGAL